MAYYASTGTAVSEAANLFYNGSLFANGTTTPWGNHMTTIATSTGQHLSLSSGLNHPLWNIRNSFGTLYIASSSPATGATTTPPAMQINPTGKGVAIATSTADAILNLGYNQGSTASSTIKMGKLQFDGYDAGGVRRCLFVDVSGALVTVAGACQ